MANSMLSNQSLLLLRSEEHFLQGNWAFINPTEVEIFNRIENMKCSQHDQLQQ